MSLTAKSRFDATGVTALKMNNEARRLEVRFVDAARVEHVVSLPIPAALELAQFIADACSFMQRLKQRPHDAPGDSKN